MAIKGKAYTKTTWAFQERPVASAKLNLWDDRIETALEFVYYLLNLVWGGNDGILRGTHPNPLAVLPTSPPSLTVSVLPGWAFISHSPFHIPNPIQLPPTEPPTTHNRIDLVQARLTTWDVAWKKGNEAPNPQPPNPDPDTLPLAKIILRPNMNFILMENDNTNGYIIDQRTFI